MLGIEPQPSPAVIAAATIVGALAVVLCATILLVLITTVNKDQTSSIVFNLPVGQLLMMELSSLLWIIYAYRVGLHAVMVTAVIDCAFCVIIAIASSIRTGRMELIGISFVLLTGMFNNTANMPLWLLASCAMVCTACITLPSIVSIGRGEPTYLPPIIGVLLGLGGLAYAIYGFIFTNPWVAMTALFVAMMGLYLWALLRNPHTPRAYVIQPQLVHT